MILIMIDRTFLMQMFDGNKALVDKFVLRFKSDAPGILEEILSAHSNRDFENLNIASHKLKSQCKYLGLTELAELAAEIEAAAKEESSGPDMDRLVQRLDTNLSGVLKSLD